jgi:DNA-binding GntR family transcriptional regulator
MTRLSSTSTATRPGSLSDEAYARLEELIITLQLPPGKAVSEAMLSDMLGIGRTPVREALQRLVRDGLIVVLPQRGTLVSDIDVAMQLRLVEVRREVERLIVTLAARRGTPEERKAFAALATRFEATATAAGRTGAPDTKRDKAFMRTDREFNELCVKASRNEFAANAVGMMHGLCRRFFFAHFREPKVLERTARLHAALARTISEGDEQGAARLLDELMDNNEAVTRITVSSGF